ncbi:hypothetical protein PVAP13_7KG001000 [Panicum virgatum]|nr:hypothetical protein PVAP13_7KG001000 [Panicum virgatum]
MIHRAILGSVERMFAILFEHYNGKWPLWLSPRQVIVCSVSFGSAEYGKQVLARLHEADFHVDIDISDRTIQKKVLPSSNRSPGQDGTAQPSPAHLVEAQEEAHPPCLLAVAAVRPSAY